MSDVINSPNMALPVPIVGQDPGPDWANNYNSCLSILDGHNHSSGSGVQITQDGISLTAAATTFNSLSFNTSNAYALRSVRFTPQSSALALSTDIGCVYEAGVDLYYNDGSGNQIRLTQGGSIVGTSGSITGLPSGTASAAYSGGTFVWQSATNTSANMDAGSYVLRNSTASSKGLTLSPPNAMAADYSLVLPALPGSTKIMALDTSGNITAPYSVDASTITISANVIGVPAGGIGTTQLAALSVTAAKIAAATITTTQIAASTIAKTNLAALGQQVSSSSGTFTTTSLTPAVDVTNLSCTITTTGRPVFMGLISAGVGATACFGIQANGGSPQNLNAYLYFFKDGVEISNMIMGGNFDATSNTWRIAHCPGALWFVDTAATAASHTYKVQAQIFNANTQLFVTNCKLLVYEL